MSSHPLPAANARARLASHRASSASPTSKKPTHSHSREWEKGTPRGSPHFLLLCLFELLQRSDNVVWACINIVSRWYIWSNLWQQRFEHWKGILPSFPPPLLSLFWSVRAWHASSLAAWISPLEQCNVSAVKRRLGFCFPVSYCNISKLWVHGSKWSWQKMSFVWYICITSYHSSTLESNKLH